MKQVNNKIEKLIQDLTSRGIFKGITDSDIETIRTEIKNIAGTAIILMHEMQKEMFETSYKEIKN